MLFAWLIACAPHVVRYPGPLAGMGAEPAEEVDGVRRRRDAPAGSAAAIVDAAEGYLGARELDGHRFDCSGLVEACLDRAGLGRDGSSAMLFDAAREARVLHHRHVPSPGDVAFFDDTYDRNGNGRLDDELSHVAIVESVDEDGTIHLVHVGSKGVVRIVMNLRRPEDHVDEAGKVLNDYLRAHADGDAPRTRYLAGELWAGFASFWKAGDQALASTR